MTAARVGDVAEQIRGVTYAKDEARDSAAPGFLPVLRAGNITNSGLTYTDLIFVPEARVSQRQRVRRNDVLVAASSGSLEVVGKTGRALTNFEGGFGAFRKILRPNERVDPAYFAHFFKTSDYRSTISSLAAGANINNLRAEHLNELRMPLPPIGEQRRIAAILDQADALRSKRREALALLDDLTQSIFLEMFGDPTDGSGRWETRPLEQIAARQKHAIVDGPFGSALKPRDYVDEGVPVIRIKNIPSSGTFLRRDLLFVKRDKYLELRRSAVSPEDVIVSRVGTIGNSCVFPEDVGDALLSTTGVCKITTDRGLMLPEFLHQSIRTRRFQEQINRSTSTSVQKYFNLSALRSWRIIVPPLWEQRLFITRLAGVHAERERQETALRVTETFLYSLQARAFSGRL